MIPRLLDGNATNFNVAGIPLADAISCKVKEERNGVFDLEMVVSTTTPYYEELAEGKLIIAKPNHTQNLQAFEIYEITRPILQRVTVRAHHISYRQSFIPVRPYSCTGITATLQGLVTNSMETNPFTFTTTITNEQSTYNQISPASLRSRLGGTEGSVLDVFGGEYLWDNFNTQLLLHRGADNGVQLRVAKNITQLEHDTNMESVVTGALPYWSDEDGTQFFYGDIQYNSNVGDYANHRTVVLDLSEQFATAPSISQLNQAGQEYVNQANLGIANKNIKVSFVDLADTDEYSASPLERVNLCDTVTVIYSPLDISMKAKVIGLTYDVIAERTIEAEIGDAKSTISKTITDLVGDVSSVIKTGKKLISVTQKIDREVGEISSTVASVQESTSYITNMLYDTNAPSLVKVHGDYDRYFSSANNSSYIDCTYISLVNPPRTTVNYGVNINVIQTIPSGKVRAIAWPNLILTAGTTYTVSCYARLSTANTGGDIGVYFCYGANPYKDAGYTETYFVASTDWVRYSWTFTADSTYFNASGKTLIYIGMFALSGTTAGGIDICDYFLQSGEPSGIDTKGSPIYQLPSDLEVLNGNINDNAEAIQVVQTNVSTISQTAEGNTRTIESIQENIGNNYYTITQTDTKISEKADSITTTFNTTITNAITGEQQRVSTMIRESGDGIAIGKSGNKIEGRFDNDSLDFVDTQNNDNRLAWVDANEGLGGSALAVGDPSNIGNRWRIFTRQSGTHLTFTRHS